MTRFVTKSSLLKSRLIFFTNCSVSPGLKVSPASCSIQGGPPESAATIGTLSAIASTTVLPNGFVLLSDKLHFGEVVSMLDSVRDVRAI